MNKKTYYVSTPIYYPNGKLHIGHFYTTTIANTLANYKKLRGYDTFIVTGIDEHGQKIQKSALKEGIEPQAFVDKQCNLFKKLWVDAELNYDFFSRTTSQQHKTVIQKIFNKMLEKGYIYLGNYEGLYSVSDEEYLTKTQAVEKEGKFYHPTSGHELETIQEETYFFEMSKFTPWITEFYNKNPNIISNPKIKNELINNFISKGLEDLSVTRVSFNWGITVNVPSKFKHIIYVWLDALFNYITALGYLTEDESKYNKYWLNGTERVHVVGKEITRFHCIYWPIFLEALSLPQPTLILSHGWIVTPTGKMSKSKGNVVDPYDLINNFGVEPTKYFFMSQINIHNDGIFDIEGFKNTINADLANNFGNLLNRTVAMANQSFENGVIFDEKALQTIDHNIYSEINFSVETYKKHFDNNEIDKALKTAISLSKTLNLYIDQTTPWKLKDDLQRLNVVLNTLLNGIYSVLVMLSPVMPNSAKKLASYIAQDQISFDLIQHTNKFDNKKLKVEEIIFQRIK
ncbi:methionine--tRNA ligase [Mycoplasma phocoenae]|uniref:Methionine--tRNA ligase n=1 Tax=Mycoplasma phocoenae TaxID=754517 RepID=A0A858U4V0_9MOLU|nr:methionine--tRNA ligase [Mycoplasma phocoenae]QJG67099.1 methionine--tRNA ligase [Mycoplasma phocoenae]